MARGGTVTVPVLPGWVDPEGDPLLLLGVDNPSRVGSVAATPNGDVVYQHSDAGGGGEEVVELTVTVADTLGQSIQKPLLVRVSPQPELAVQSFAVIDTVGAGITVDVAPHVTGTTGTMSLDSVRVLDDAAASATIVGGTTTFDFSASSPGSFRVDFTVTDGLSDATGTARITVLPEDAPPQLATAPVVAFVHPQRDATLDIFAAVSNPTRRVLLLSDVVAAADDGASLSVDAVGQNHLRVSGSTASGEPGRLGTVSYIVSDGTDDQGARVEGEATVYLLPPAPELAPIAVDDTVVVRAGAQIDIPVLENDLSPAGGRPTLNPASIASSTPDALAFGSGDLLRYLAPDEPGEYGVEYSVFTTGAPSLADTASVRIRVLGDDANRAPAAETLEGRVLSGQSTLVAFDGFGMDPDGDVVTLDRIVSQPERGSATISADGASILYSSVPGHRGQVSFRYRVVDALGQTGEGIVRIGVLDGQSNPSPITFTDYVQVQAGEGNTIRVSPLSNDVDPTMGTLELTDVRPDVPAYLVDGSENFEFTRLDDRIVSAGDTTVVIEAGEEPGTMAFLYDIESSSGNTGRGLIVVEVVRESVPDYPVVADTALTAETREDFPRGVDVLTDKASWSGGEVSDLTLSLWGDPEGVTVDDDELRGALPATTRVIPFAVTGDRTRRRRHDVCVPPCSRRRRSGTGAEIRRAIARGERTGVGLVRHGRSGREAPREPARGRDRCARFRRPPGCRVRGLVGRDRPVRLGRRGALGGRVPGAGAHRGPGGLDLPVGADPGAAARSAAGAARGVDDGRTGRDRHVRPPQHDHVAAARGLGRHPLRTRLRRFGVRRVARGIDRDRGRRRPRGAGRRRGRDDLGDEPHGRGAGASHLPGGRGSLDHASGRVIDPAVHPGIRHFVLDLGGRRARPGEPAAAHTSRSRRRASGGRVRRGDLRRRECDVGHRLVGRGRSRRDVRRDLLGARRPGPAHQRRTRRSAPPGSARVSEGAGQRHPDRVCRRHPDPPRRPGRGPPGLPGTHRVRPTVERPGRRDLHRGRHLSADRRAERRGQDVSGVRRQRRRRVARQRPHGRLGVRSAGRPRGGRGASRSSPRARAA